MNPDSTQIPPKHKPTEGEGGTHGRIVVPPQPPPPDADEHERYECRPDQTPVWKIVLEVLALVVLFGYTRAAYKQLDALNRTIEEMQRQTPAIQAAAAAATKANNDAEARFREAQRPYIWILPFQEQPIHWQEDRATRHLQVVIPYKNYGLSPAVVTRFMGDLEFGPDPARKFHRTHWTKNPSIVPPGNKPDWIILSSSAVVTSETLPIIESAGGKAAFVRIQYQDTGNHLYESDICFIGPGKEVPDGAQRLALYCPAELNLNRVIDCEKERCEP